MKKYAFHTAFALGLAALLWVAAMVARSHLLVLLMTAAIGGVYLYGALELRRYRLATAGLQQALSAVPEGLTQLSDWLERVPANLRQAVRQRIEGERSALPGPALTPYLVGLLVMLGMLGTFLGMVATLHGAVFALEASASVQGMRAAFSEPIRGLGLAFGTSVAGVATSAMLGLMSSLSRRERAHSAQTLDELIGSRLRSFSLVHQRQASYQALQQQTQALPIVVEQLQSLMTQMERHSQQLGERLLANQDRFHHDVKTVYSELARSVDQSLRSSMSDSVQLASDSIRPVVQSTLAELAQQARQLQERVVGNTQEQLSALNQQFSSADQQRLLSWQAALQDMASDLQNHWQTAGAQTLAQQQQVCETLSQTAAQIRSDSESHSTRTVGEITRLLASSEELVRIRIASEAETAAQQTRHAEALAALLRTELSALREQEAQRGDAAVARLAELQTVVTQHLSTLGTALEDPITRLIETASEAPKAAAEVIGQLRQEISVSVARDNALLEERTRILGTLGTLLEAINHASAEQRGVIDALVSASQASLAQASEQFHAHVTAETGKLGDVAAQLTASAVDVASLGETFGFAVRSFNETHEKLIVNLQRIEAAIDKSMARSDEQLAYYVAQAREIIDLSISSQKDVLEALQQRQSEGAA